MMDAFKFLAVLVCSVAVSETFAEEAEFTVGIIGLLNENDTVSDKVCFTYAKNFYNLSASQNDAVKDDIQMAISVDPCNNPFNGSNQAVKGKILVMTIQENCTDFKKFVEYAVDGQAKGLIIHWGENTYRSDRLPIFLATILSKSFAKLQNLTTEDELQAKLYEVNMPRFEIAMIILWGIACFCVGVGTVLSAWKWHRTDWEQNVLCERANPQQDHDAPPYSNFFNTYIVLLMIVTITSTLLLLYFFYDYMVYFFISVFALASGKALYDLTNLFIVKMGLKFTCVSSYCGLRVYEWAVAAFSITVVTIWFFLRNMDNIWILQDALAISFCINLILNLQVKSLKLITLMLGLLFVYDVFFVFITPYLTSDGKSIMTEVATGGRSESDEKLPLVVLCPYLSDTELDECLDFQGNKRAMMLGFGDIIIPGIFVSFTYLFDLKKKTTYFVTSMIGYACGLALAFLLLGIFQTGQPALFYIVPCTLIPIYVEAYFRGDLRDIWKGQVTVPTDQTPPVI